VYRPTLYHKIPVKYQHIPWASDPKAMRQRIDDQISELGLRDSVSLVEMEAPERHEPYFAGSDVAVEPFESALFSSVNLIESLVYGRPHIVTDLGEPADIVNRWGGGVKVPPANAPALAQAMVELYRDDARREMLSQQAHKAALEFGVDAVAERLSRLYARVVADRAGARRESLAA
jgi:phenylacetate-CoA ligase